MTCLITGTKKGSMLSSSSPMPSSSRVQSGSAAISPHMLTRFPARLAACTVQETAVSTAGCNGS